jgi:hypothetical protein
VPALRLKLLATGVQDFGAVGLGGLGGLVALARRQGLVDARTVTALEGLVVMRNLAVHGRDVTAEQAQEFVALANDAMYSLGVVPKLD